MSYLEGIGDEVVVIFTVILAIILMTVLASLIPTQTRTLTPESGVPISQRFLQEQSRVISQLGHQVSQRHALLSEEGQTPQHLETIPESSLESDFQINSVSQESSRDVEENHHLLSSTRASDIANGKNTDELVSNPSIREQFECETTIDRASSGELKLNEHASSSDDLDEDSNDPTVIRQRRLDFFTKEKVESESNSLTGLTSNTNLDKKITTSLPNGVVNSISSADNPLNPILEGNNTATTFPNLVNSENSGNVRDGEFTMRLKFLDDRERIVTAKSDELVGDFKRRLFPEELAQRKVIRLIYSGQQLQDARTLQTYRLCEGSVLHIQISAGPPEGAPSENRSNEELDLGQFLWPFLGVILGGVWMLHYQYRDMFNGSSTVALIGLSGLFLTFVWTQFGQRPSPAPQ